jgi:hypothetical protein
MGSSEHPGNGMIVAPNSTSNEAIPNERVSRDKSEGEREVIENLLSKTLQFGRNTSRAAVQFLRFRTHSAQKRRKKMALPTAAITCAQAE